MKIEVTADDIKRGRQYDPEQCPIARAVKRTTGKESAIGPIYAWISPYTNRASLPLEARLFVRSFDDGEDVEPFVFELDFNGN